jgi:hypothetical protein
MPTRHIDQKNAPRSLENTDRRSAADKNSIALQTAAQATNVAIRPDQCCRTASNDISWFQVSRRRNVSQYRMPVVNKSTAARLAGRHYSALFSSIATGALIGIVSAMVFGIDLWLAWLKSLPTFLDIVRHNGLSGIGVTPVSMASQLGFHGAAELALRLVLGLTGIVLCWRFFASPAVCPTAWLP